MSSEKEIDSEVSTVIAAFARAVGEHSEKNSGMSVADAVKAAADAYSVSPTGLTLAQYLARGTAAANGVTERMSEIAGFRVRPPSEDDTMKTAWGPVSLEGVSDETPAGGPFAEPDVL